MGDLHNYPKVFVMVLKKWNNKNDKQLKPVLLFDFIDKDNPRVEIELYPVSKYDISYNILKNKDFMCYSTLYWYSVFETILIQQ